MLMSKEDSLLSHITFKEMKIIRIIPPLCCKKPTFDIKKTFCVV